MVSITKNISGEKNIPLHVVAVFGIVQKDNKYLLAKRSSDDPQSGGEWSVPSGKVEIEETDDVLLKTLKREIKEEVGLEIEDEIALLKTESFTRVSGHNVIAITFLCKWKAGKAKPLEDQQDVKWMTLEQINNFKELPEYTRHRFDRLFDKL